MVKPSITAYSATSWPSSLSQTRRIVANFLFPSPGVTRLRRLEEEYAREPEGVTGRSTSWCQKNWVNVEFTMTLMVAWMTAEACRPKQTEHRRLGDIFTRVLEMKGHCPFRNFFPPHQFGRPHHWGRIGSHGYLLDKVHKWSVITTTGPHPHPTRV